MGQVIPFIARVRDAGDWSDAERAKLEELGDRLAGLGVNVEVTFGATDEGDPWCVVTDENGEVLIHVARIGGTFVVHSALDDSLKEGADLHAVLRDQVSAAADWAAPASSAEILPFGARHAQTLLALIAAAAFFYETAGPTPAHAAEAEPPKDTPHEPVAPPHLPADSDDHDIAIRGAAVSDKTHDEPAPAAPVTLTPEPAALPQTHAPAAELVPLPEAHAEAAPAPQAAVLELTDAETTSAPPEPPVEIHGTDGDDLLVGTARDEHIEAGAGNDTLQGGGGHDTLDGGAGNDTIELGQGVVAIGGAGADTFVIRPPPVFGHPELLLGHIFDFSQLDGDRVMTWRGDRVALPPGVDGAMPEHGPNLSGTFATTTRVDVDLDGDGHADGYLLFGHGPNDADGHPKPPPPPPEPPPPDGDHPITLVGHVLDWHHEPGT